MKFKTEPSVFLETPTYKCSVCHKPTAPNVLSTFGARCNSCFTEYCKAIPEPKKYPEFKGSHGWALRLQWRHQQGENLSDLQIEKYKQCLGVE